VFTPNQSPPPAELTAIVLAAGASTRMHGFKPLLDLGGQSVLARVVGLLQNGGAAPVVVVTGHRAPELEPLVRQLGARPVFNPAHVQGMFSSLRAGLAALPSRAEAFFLLPVDIPLVRAHTLIRLVQAWAAGQGPVLLPTFQGEPGHPPLISTELVPAIAAHDGAGGLRGFWEAHPGLIAEVPVADRFILRDQDRPEDYQALRDELPGYHAPSPAECLTLLSEVAGLSAELVIHSRAVGAVALALAQQVNTAGGGLDQDLALAGGLLHDLAKGTPDHAAAGAAQLRELGFAAVAPLAAGHVDLEVDGQAPLSEVELVHLADKLVQGGRLVGLEERFAAKLARHGDQAQARAAIQRRRETARLIRQRVEQAMGKSLDQALAKVDPGGTEWTG